MNDKFGKSCIFGIIDKGYAGELVKEGLRPEDCKNENEVSEMCGEGMIIAEFNCAQKTIGKPTPVEFPTIQHIKHKRLHPLRLRDNNVSM